MIEIDDTIALMKARILRFPPTECVSNLTSAPRPPVSNKTVDALEHETGLRLPEFLRRLYTEVADGGYGPAWGVNELLGDDKVPKC